MDQNKMKSKSIFQRRIAKFKSLKRAYYSLIILTSCYITIKTRKMSYVLCNLWFNSPFKWCDIPYFPSLVNRKIAVFVLKKPEVLHSHLGHYPRHLSTSMSTNAFYFIVVPTNIVIWIFLSIYSALYHFLCSSFYLF